ncbi:MAG: glycogen synthase [Ruminococcaceae bacterium]|nr:glycogen synthase [Oscillospiraceae bacterium]
MKIVFTASEAAPFIKTGGLGDVAEALPAALSRIKGNQVILFLPYYGKIKNNPNIETEYITHFTMDLSWRKQHVGIFKYKSNKRKLKVYFIDNEYYFNRDREYGHLDDGERFAYFSKAILESLIKLKIKPDIIHCNDWQTAMVPVFLHAFYNEKLGNAKTVFTIHNIEYQGLCHPYFLGDTLGLDGSYESKLTYKDNINFMKGAILSVDALTTVSKTYANEIKYPYYAHGLSPIIEEHAFKLDGVVNGINLDTNNPETDQALFCNYNKKTFIEGKAKNKEELQKKLGLDVRSDVPLIGMVSRIVSHKGFEIICDIAKELMKWDIQIVILGTGDPSFENMLRRIADDNKSKFSLNLCFDSKMASQIYAASDIYLMPSKSEPCGLSQLIAMRYGTVPVVNATGGLKDTVIPFDGADNGTGFNFQTFSRGDLLDALRRCLEVYGGNKSAWNKIVTNAMEYDSSWDKPAGEYMEIYTKIMT